MILDPVDDGTDRLETSLKRYHERDLRLGCQQSIAEAPPFAARLSFFTLRDKANFKPAEADQEQWLRGDNRQQLRKVPATQPTLCLRTETVVRQNRGRPAFLNLRACSVRRVDSFCSRNPTARQVSRRPNPRVRVVVWNLADLEPGESIAVEFGRE